MVPASGELPYTYSGNLQLKHQSVPFFGWKITSNSTVKRQPKWRWSNCSGLTISKFINHNKDTFPSARTCPYLSQFPRQVKHVRFPSISRYRETRKIFSIISVTQKVVWTRSLIFYHLIDMNINTRNLSVCNSGHYVYDTGLCNFFFVLRDLIDKINSYFQRIAFQRNLLLIGF